MAIKPMKLFAGLLSVAGIGLLAGNVLAQTDNPYKVLDTTQLMGSGGIDYVYADNDGRRVYVPRGGNTFVFDLDTTNTSAPSPTSAVTAWPLTPPRITASAAAARSACLTRETMQKIKGIEVQGRPDGILLEPFTGKVLILSHDRQASRWLIPRTAR